MQEPQLLVRPISKTILKPARTQCKMPTREVPISHLSSWSGRFSPITESKTIRDLPADKKGPKRDPESPINSLHCTGSPCRLHRSNALKTLYQHIKCCICCGMQLFIIQESCTDICKTPIPTFKPRFHHEVGLVEQRYFELFFLAWPIFVSYKRSLLNEAGFTFFVHLL